MASALSAKFAKGQLMIADGMAEVEAKTKAVMALSEKYQWEDGGVLIIGSERATDALKLATRNVHFVDLHHHSGLNVYSILKRKHLVIAKDALELLDKHVPL